MGDLRDQEISQVYVSATAGSRRREREARGRRGERGGESSLEAEAGLVSLGPAQRRAGPSVMTQDAGLGGGGGGGSVRLPLPPPGQGRIWRGLVSQEGVVLAALIQGPLTWEGNPIASSCLSASGRGAHL